MDRDQILSVVQVLHCRRRWLPLLVLNDSQNRSGSGAVLDQHPLVYAYYPIVSSVASIL